MKNEEQSQNLLPKVDPRSTFHNNFLILQQSLNEHLCCATSRSRKVKNAKRRPKTSNEKMLRDTLKDFVSYFAAFTLVWVAGLPIVCYTVGVCCQGSGTCISHFAALNSTLASEPTMSPPANKKQSEQYLQY